MLCGLILFPSGLPASPAPGPAPLEARLGFDGVLKIGVPLPAEVRVTSLASAGPAEIRVEAPVLGPQAGVVTTSTVISFESIPGVARTFHFPVVVSDIRRPLMVRALLGGREVVRRTIAIDPARVGGRVVVAVSSDRGGLAFLHRLPGRIVAADVTEASLPSLWQEYAGVDLLAVRDLDPARVDDAQRRALLTWVRMGGRLVLVARPGMPVPAFLSPLLPARVGSPRTVSSLDSLARRFGAALRSGPVVLASLAPLPGADEVRSGGVPVIASGPQGWGWVTVWSFDPWEPPFRGWAGNLRLWADALGDPAHPLVDAGVVAGRLSDHPPFNPLLHGAVGAAILGYIVLVYALRRRAPPAAAAASGLVVACLAVGAFAALAGDIRSRSTALVQATFFEQAPAGPVARARAIAVASVPYGGPYRLRAPRDAIAVPAASSGDLRLDLTAGGAVLSGFLRPGENGRAFEALGAVPLDTSGTLSSDDRDLTVDLRAFPLRRAEVRWADRIYLLGDLPAGVTVRRLRPDLWIPQENVADDRGRAWIFRGSGGDVIMKRTTPVLVGEMERQAPPFAFEGPEAPGRQPTILLVPLARR